jgi:hypothetical protein
MTRLPLICCLLLVCLPACDGSSTGQGGAGGYGLVDATGDKRVAAPAGKLIYQPMLTWDAGEPTFQGTGFFVKTPDGEVVGVTSAHYVDFDAKTLIKVDYMSVTNGRSVAAFDKLLGPVGQGFEAGADDEALGDASADFLLFTADHVPTGLRPLELDSRDRFEKQEPVWLVNKDAMRPPGYELLEGYLHSADRDCVYAVFEPAFELRSQSGSPVISQRTGKVVGVLAAGGSEDDQTGIYLTPARHVAAALDSEQRRALRSINTSDGGE